MVTVVKENGIDDEKTTRAIVRCDFTTGACELATTPQAGTLVLGS